MKKIYWNQNKELVWKQTLSPDIVAGNNQFNNKLNIS